MQVKKLLIFLFIKAIVKKKSKRELNGRKINYAQGPSTNWFRGFMQRHPELKFSKPAKTNPKYDEGFTPERVKSYFEELGQ